MEHGGEIITRWQLQRDESEVADAQPVEVLAVSADRQAGRHDRGTGVLLLDRDSDGIRDGPGEAGLHRPPRLNDLDVDEITDQLTYLGQQLSFVSGHVTAVDARLG